jgi:hypothetical protein
MVAARAKGKPPRRNNVIYSYFVASTKMQDVFYELLNSFVEEDVILNLNPKDDDKLIQKLEYIIETVFPTSKSIIPVNYERNLLNIFWRVLGYTIPGKEDGFEKVDSYNAEFNSTIESIIANVVAGMIDNPNVPLKLSNPSALLNDLNMLKTQLSNRTNNLVNRTADFWADSFDKLIFMLEDPELQKALNINIPAKGANAEALAARLKRVAEKLGISVPINSESLFVLAEKLGIFLARVEDTDWDINKANDLYKDADNLFHDISHHWGRITGKKFYEEAIAIRH